MTIAGGLDIHRKQLTFDYPGTVTGEVKRGQITPADRAHLRAWLARFAGCDDVAFALEGCTGWRYVAGELAAAGCAARVAGPADTAAARGRKRHAKTDKTDSRHLRQLLAEAGSRSAGSRPATSWNAGRCPGCVTTSGPSTPPRRSCAVFFHHGAPQLGAGALRTGQGIAAVRAAAAAHLSPAGQLQVATALDVLTCLEGHLEEVRHRLLDTARHLTGAKVLAARGVRRRAGHRAGDDLLAGRGGGRFSSSRQAVRFAGLDITVCSSDCKRSPGHLSRQGPAVLRWAVYEAGKVHAGACAPDHDYYAQLRGRYAPHDPAARSQDRQLSGQGAHRSTP